MMSAYSLYLLRERRFLPLFATMFLGAFNDNLFKNALIVLATFEAAYTTSLSAPMLAAVASGVFVLPFFLFSATAGQIADRYEKSFLIRLLQYSELGIMLLGALGLYLQHTWFLIFVLFCIAAQSAFFGPIKYSILPDHLRREELVSGNALVEAATFLAILLGTITGGLVVMGENGEQLVSVLVIAVALAGIISSRFIPSTTAASPDLPIQKNILVSTWHVMGYARENRPVFLSILGIAWFWFVGATFVSQFPPYVRDYIGGNEQVVTVFLTAFSIGVACGAMICSRLLRGEITARHVPLALLGVALNILIVVLLSGERQEVAQLMGARAFFADTAHLVLFAALVLLSACAGFVSVPLFAVMQARSMATHRARVIAASNIMDALFMVGASLLAMLMLGLGMTIPDLFLVTALGCLPAAWLMKRVERKD